MIPPLLFAIAALLCSGVVTAQPPVPETLDELLEQLQEARSQQAERNVRREKAFLAERDSQQRKLEEARAALLSEQQRSELLQESFDENESTTAELRARLDQRAGALLELFGASRQVAGQAKAVFEDSLISSQFRDREKRLAEFSADAATPEIDDLEDLWQGLLQEMVESGKVARYQAEVIGSGGASQQRLVTRIGTFNAVSDGKFLRYLPEHGWLQELHRQPPARFRAMATGLEQAVTGTVPMVVDPTRGSVLNLLIQVPDLVERIQQGRLVGYVIIAVAAIGLLIALERTFYLLIVGRKIKKQIDSATPNPSNPLGRIMALYQETKDSEMSVFELKLEELVLRDTPKLQKGLQTLKILAVIAPLLGLLGTVTGLIETFQSLTLFGTGDPRLMAGGISQALVTTVLGLVTAIVLILFHSGLLSKSRGLIVFLEEQSAGIMALHLENRRSG